MNNFLPASSIRRALLGATTTVIKIYSRRSHSQRLIFYIK